MQKLTLILFLLTLFNPVYAVADILTNSIEKIENSTVNHSDFHSNLDSDLYVVAKIANVEISNRDVEHFIEDVKMDDIFKVLLFKESGTFDKYLELKHHWIKKNYTSGLKQLIYLIMVTEISKQNILATDYAFFKTPMSEYNQTLRERESSVLDPIIKKRKLGIEDARIFFGNKLREMHYPHQQGTSSEQLFWAWYANQERKIKQQYQQNNVRKWELYIATEGKGKIDINSFDILPSYKKSKKQVELKLQGKKISANEVAGILKNNAFLKVSIKAIEVVDLSHQSLCEIMRLSTASQVKKEFVEHIKTQFMADFLDKILFYESKTLKLSQKYSSISELKKLIASNLKDNATVLDSDYRNMMLTMLYKLTINYKQNGAGRDKMLIQFKQLYPYLVKNMIKQIEIRHNFCQLEIKDLKLENYLAKINKKFILKYFPKLILDTKIVFNKANSINNYTENFLTMALWLIQFQVKKLSLDYRSTVNIQFSSPYTKKGIDKVTDYIKQQKIAANRKKKNQLLRDFYSDSIEVYLNKNTKLSAQQAMDFILN